MDKLNLKAIRDRCEKATKEKWVTTKTKDFVSVASLSEHSRIYISYRDPVCLPETFARQKSDADFISHSRTDLPALLDALEGAIAIIRKADAWWKVQDKLEADEFLKRFDDAKTFET